MRQSLHIFRKDLRYLHREILLIWALAIAFAWGVGWTNFLLLTSGAFTIGRLVHAEAIPGDRQFWITRPYRWRSLLAAKLGFILLLVSLPFGLAQLTVVVTQGFPLASSLPRLLWSQVLLVLCLWLPLATVAALTSGVIAYTLAGLGLMAVGFTALPALAVSANPWPSGVDWMRNSVVVVLAAAAGMAILYLQYQRRRTLLGRALAAIALAAGVLLYRSLPWPAAFQLQSQLSAQPEAGSAIHVALNSAAAIFAQPVPRGNDALLHIPLSVSGVRSGVDVRFDGAAVTVRSAGGRKWTQHAFNLVSSSVKDGALQFDATFHFLDPALLAAVRSQPVTVHGAVYLALFAQSRETAAPLRDTPIRALDGLQCYRDRFSVVFCRSAFRWPRELVYTRVTHDILNPINTLISYSPFPAGLSLDPVEEHWASGPPLATPDVALVAKQPIAYVVRDFEIRDVSVYHANGLYRRTL
ncbi:MAG: hypothetical protein LAP40_27605 [Acidobacteriia bacterium]|nr:hypothetical protein [Terriglobia bacterium]